MTIRGERVESVKKPGVPDVELRVNPESAQIPAGASVTLAWRIDKAQKVYVLQGPASIVGGSSIHWRRLDHDHDLPGNLRQPTERFLEVGLKAELDPSATLVNGQEHRIEVDEDDRADGSGAAGAPSRRVDVLFGKSKHDGIRPRRWVREFI